MSCSWKFSFWKMLLKAGPLGPFKWPAALATAILGEFREEGQLQRRGRSQRGLEVRPGVDPTPASASS